MQKCKMLVMTMAIMLICVLMPGLSAEAADQTGFVSGTEETVSWSYDEETKTVTVTGEGKRTEEKTYGGFPKEAERVVFKDCHISGSISYFFQEMSNVTEIDMGGLDTSDVTDMSYMFSGCSSLNSLDLSGLDTSNVTSMRYMFSDCSSLSSLDLSGLDTSNVTSMSNMFKNCSNLSSLNLSGFNTSKVESMYYMFCGCSNLSSLELSSFNTSKVVNMSWMFYNCSKLSSLDIGNFNTSNVTKMSFMFYGCSSLNSLNVKGLDTSNVTDMSYMFSGCSSLSSLDLSSFDTSNVTNMIYMFSDCSNLNSLDLSSFDTSKVTSMSYMFLKCSNLSSLDIGSFDVSNVKKMTDIFRYCSKLEKIHVPRVMGDISVSLPNTLVCGTNTFVDYMDKSCEGMLLTAPNLSWSYDADTKTVTITGTGKSKEWKGSKIFPKEAERIVFEECYIDGGLHFLFLNMSNVTEIDMSGLDSTAVTSMRHMFSGCSSLKSLIMDGLDTSNVVSMESMFVNCRNLRNLDVSNFNTGSVKNMNSMFAYCSNLTNLDVSSFNTGSVKDMSSMFAYCRNLTKLDLSNFKMLATVVSEAVKNPTDKMLTGCDVLQELHTPSDMGDDTIALPAVFNNGEYDISVVDANTQNMILRRGAVPSPTPSPIPTESPASAEQQVEAFVKRMYTVALGREGDADGLNYWSKELIEKNRDGAGIAVEFILKGEFIEKNYSDSEFVDILYAIFFDREADSAGNAYWCEKLAAGESRATVLSGFVNSQEFFDICCGYGISRGVLRADGTSIHPGIYSFAERLYLTVLERAGDKGGIEYWTCCIDERLVTPEDAAISFFMSEEYTAKNTTDDMYIRTLYRTFMNREADEGGLAYWKSVLNGGDTREKVLQGFACSTEFKEIVESLGL